MKKIKFPRRFLDKTLICSNENEKSFLIDEIKKINSRFNPKIIISKNFDKLLLKKNDYMFFLDKYQVIIYFDYFLKNNEKKFSNFLEKIKNKQILFENNILKDFKKELKDGFLDELNDISPESINSYYKGIIEFSNKFVDLKIIKNKKIMNIAKRYSTKDKGIYKFDNYNFNKENFLKYVEEKVFLTTDYILDSLKKRNQKIGNINIDSDNNNNNNNIPYKMTIATSGGKDSLTVLSLLKKYSDNHDNCFDITALCIDEGIKGYRSHTIEDLNDFCNNLGIKYRVISFEDYYKISLDDAVKKSKLLPCNICGVFRRQTLNYGAIQNGSDIIATGHNFDDEYQAFKMNIVKNNNDQYYKMGPITGYLSNDNGFVQRIKPLYFLTEKEVLIYSILKNFKVKYNECPYAYASFRGRIRDIINKVGYNKINSFNLMFSFFEYIKNKDINNNIVGRCEICNEPSSNKICKACLLKRDLGLNNFKN